MAAEPPFSWTELFVVARFAHWAGDSEYASELLRRVRMPESSRQSRPPAEREPEHIAEVIRESVEKLANGIREERRELSSLERAALPPLGPGLRLKPLVLKTRYLRAVLRPLDLRRFELRGYMRRLLREPELFLRARELTEQFGDPDSRERAATLAVADRTRGGSWFMKGPLTRFVTVDDLGLIQVAASWSRVRLPTRTSQVLNPLMELLEMLDRGSNE